MGWLARVCLIFAVTAFLFIIIAFVTPGWMIVDIRQEKTAAYYEQFSSNILFNSMKFNIDDVLNHPQIEVNMGLMYIVVCVGSTCVTMTMDGLETLAKMQSSDAYILQFEKLKYYRNLGIVSVVVSFIGMIMTVAYMCHHKRSVGSWWCGVAACTKMGIAGILAAILDGNFVNYTHIELETSSKYMESIGMKFSTPYSIILMGFGTAFSILTIVPLVIALKPSGTGLLQSGQVISTVEREGDVQLPIVQRAKSAIQGYARLQDEHIQVPAPQPV